MKTPTFTLLPPAPATRLAIEAFHLRERRLRAVLAALICGVLATICAALCYASSSADFRAVGAGVAVFNAGAGVLYLLLAAQDHRELRRKLEGLNHE